MLKVKKNKRRRERYRVKMKHRRRRRKREEAKKMGRVSLILFLLRKWSRRKENLILPKVKKQAMTFCSHVLAENKMIVEDET